MGSLNFRSYVLIFAAAILLYSLSSCRTHNGGRACPSYGSIAKAKKQA